MGIEERILDENDVLSYADAAIKLGDTVKALTKEQGANILIPSRGSFPIWNLAKKYLYLQHAPGYYEQIKGIDMPLDGLLPAESFERAGGGILVDPTKLNREIILPMSAFADDNSSRLLREFWIKTYDQIQKRNMDDLGVKFYQHILKNVSRFLTDRESFDETVEAMNGKPEAMSGMEPVSKYVPDTFHNRKTLLIDTVMSGNCLMDVLGAMEKTGMDYHAVIITDKNGNDVKPKNRSYIRRLGAEGKVTEIPVDSLFTEDNGPALLGVTTIVYPSITELASKSGELAARGLDYAVAACWMPIPFRKLKTREPINVDLTTSAYLTKTMMTEALAIQLSGTPYQLEELDGNSLLESFERSHKSLVTLVGEKKLLDSNRTLEQYRTFLEEIAETRDIDSTGSHVLKINYSKERSEKVLKDFYESLRA
jgi:hypothetical protein